MKIYSNGKDRTLTGSFPARFKLLNNGVEVPFIRTGKESVRLSGDIPFGELDIEEVVRQKTPQPAKLDAQSLAIINKADFDQIDLLNKKLAINQEQMNAHLKALTEQEATLANLETQNAQAIEQVNVGMAEMAGVFGKEIQADRERIKATAKSIAQDIADSSEVLNAKIEVHEKAKNPHKITKETIGLDKVENTSDLDKPVSKATQKALDKKADKSDIEDVRKEIKETEKKQERLVKAVDNANLYGGIGGNELPSGGKKGQILSKSSNKTGDYKWIDNSGSPSWGNIGGNINNQTDLKNALDAKQNVIDDLDTIRAGATAGSTALQPNDDISELNNNVGYITGITSSDVVTALGYTPYDSTNPDDFQTGQDVASAVSAETTNRENADINLQSQIDAITASSDVKDIVGTYAQLQAYDTSTLGNNDIIKVLQDETHSNETTYYRWSTTTETFTLIGEEGPYYTKSEANSTFVPQTRTVNGKALSSDISLTYSDVGAQQAGNYVTTNTAQTITEAKTFTKAVHFTGTGDTNAVFLTENTRFDIEGTTRTILGMGSAQFYINHSAYALLLRGKNARPSYNSATSYLALLSDLDGYVPTTRTVNGKALSSDISLTASDVGALPDSTTIGNATLTIQKNGTAVDTFNANATSDKTINITVPTSAADVSALPSSTKYGADLSYSSNTLQLKDQDGNNLGSPVTISGGGSLPSQTGNSGKFLTTDGTDASWASVSQVPSQTGQSGKFLTTDGTDASWESIPSDSSKANTSLDNLTSTGKNISNWSSNVTNCITYIPQDIKLELNNGTLTLKAGSKVYVPNGFEQDGTTPKFDTIIIQNDITSGWSGNGSGMCFLNGETLTSIDCYFTDRCFSGSSAPAVSSTYAYWYDTTNNLIKLTSNTGSTWSGKFSLPLFITTGNGSIAISIDQVFNGFGYIGSTVFALPGVKGLIPSGRNYDGSLRNTEVSTSEVVTANLSGTYTNKDVRFYANGIWVSSTSDVTYNEVENRNYLGGSILYQMVCGKLSISSNKITSFNPKTVFHALDYNDRVIIEEQLPSASNNYLWYRKYASGFVEQGGVISLSLTATNIAIAWSTSLPVAMKNNNYTVNVTARSGWALENNCGLEGVSTTNIFGYIKTSGGTIPRGADIYWCVAGLYA